MTAPAQLPATRPPPPQRRRRLGELLRGAGLLSEVQLNAALVEQKKWGGKLGRVVVEMGFATEADMALALSRHLGLPAVDLDTIELPADVAQRLRVDLAERYGVFPLGGDAEHRTVHLAMSDPTNAEVLQDLGFRTGKRFQVFVATSSGIDRAIRRHYYGESTTASRTATPQEMGLEEPTYDLVSSALPAASPDRLDAMAAQLARLEELMASQVAELRALRAALEK